MGVFMLQASRIADMNISIGYLHRASYKHHIEISKWSTPFVLTDRTHFMTVDVPVKPLKDDRKNLSDLAIG
jgi:NADH:ubiquinone oxidoreductase subunit D